MDVRCEKCQTEYELDESRLKPGGVTVKCTNCGHMFKIRKRTPTNVTGVPTTTNPGMGARPPGVSGGMGRADSILHDRSASGLDEHRPLEEGPTTVERQWVIRLENGEQKTCRELATLQQWIVGNVVSRESLISRTGKTWKRLGDITELAQYFDIADEARTGRADKATKPVTKAAAGTMLGVGASAAGGTILPDDEADTGRATGNFRSQGARPVTPPPPTRTPPMGSNVATPARRPITPPPKSPTGPVPLATAPTLPAPRASAPTPQPPKPQIPEGEPRGVRGRVEAGAGAGAPENARAANRSDNRSTAMWASDPIKSAGGGPAGPSVGKFAAIPDEPAFAGRVRVSPSDESSFDTGRVGMVDDDDDLMPRRGGSKAGIIILAMMLLVGAGAAAVVYLFVIKKDDTKIAVVADAGSGSAIVPDAAQVVVAPIIDATEAPPPTPLETARAELGQNVEARLRTQLDALVKDAPETQALRANLGAAIVQSLNDRAGLVADKTLADKLRKESKTLILDAATAAQRALKTAPDDPAANIAMAHVLRLQGKSLKDMQRYLDAAKPTGDDVWARDRMLAEALVHARDGKLDDARKALEAIDSGQNKLETSNDVRARFHLALIALAQNRTADAKAAVDAILAAQPEHAGAKDLAAKLETKTSSTDPLPPEEPGKDPGKGSNTVKPPPGGDVSTTGTYDQLLARANKLAETSCGKAMELFAKALEQKPNGVEALSGQGYCHIDAKQFASAFSKFRSALAISPRYEPALWGIAEAYQQQGRREQALEAYKAYLDAYPGTAKAQKQIERLQGGAPTPTPGSGSAAAPNPTPPAQDPTQQPQKPDAPPEGGGSGAQ